MLAGQTNKPCRGGFPGKGKTMNEKRKYFYLSRPPCVGTEPGGWIEREGWTPTRSIGFRHGHGFVIYPHKLDFESIWKYSLMPADLKEQAEMVFWQEDQEIKNDYLAANPKFLHEHRYTDNKAWAALVLLDLI